MSAIAILSPGEMGAAVATRLLKSGADVVTCLAGRGPATAERAARAGLLCLPSLDDVTRQADLIVSLVTPFGALPLAREVAQAMQRTGGHPVYVDANSISPSTAEQIGALMAQSGARFVDGGIIGGASELDRATFYLSGPGAEEVAGAIGPAVHASVVGPRPGQASGLKILNAGLSKGLTGLGVELLLCAQGLGLLPEIMARYRAARPCVADLFERILPDLPPKASRRAEEMHELTDLMESMGLTAHMSRASQRVLAMVADRFTAEGAAEWSALAEALLASAGPSAAEGADTTPQHHGPRQPGLP